MERLTFSGLKFNIEEDKFCNLTPLDDSKLMNGFYFSSNDKINFRYGPKGSDCCVVVGISNHHFLHVISLTEQYGNTIKRIIGLDINIAQVYHFLTLLQIIKRSKNRIDYIENLLCIETNNFSKSILEKVKISKKFIVEGAEKNANQFILEKKFWDNVSFDNELFKKKYHLSAKKVEGGIKVKSETVGDINNYVVNLFCGSKSDYGLWPFPIGYGSGYLRSEKTFEGLKSILNNVPIYIFHTSIEQDLDLIMRANRYKEIILYLSNVFCEYFLKKSDKLPISLKELIHIITKSKANPNPLKIFAIQDQRTKKSDITPKRKWLQNPFKKEEHYIAFQQIENLIEGNNNLEIVNVDNWLKHNNKSSKLINTKIKHVNDFLKLDFCKYDTIFLHSLLSHKLDQESFKKLVDKSLKSSKRVLILENNICDKYFKKLNQGVSMENFRHLLKNSSFEINYMGGAVSKFRNIIAVN